jgi:hypothetical protein
LAEIKQKKPKLLRDLLEIAPSSSHQSFWQRCDVVIVAAQIARDPQGLNRRA